MSEQLIIALALIAVILILCLVALFRFESVTQTLKGWGIDFGLIVNKRNRRDQRGKATNPQSNNGTEATGDSNIRIGGKIESSKATADGKRSGTVDVGKSATDSTIRARGKNKAGVDVDGDVTGSDISARSG